MNKKYTVAEWNFGSVQDRVKKLNRKAAKVGMPPVTLNKLDTRYVPDTANHPHIAPIYCPKICVIDFELVSETIKLAGWSFLGTLDHYSLPGKVMVHTVPGQVVPEIYFNSKPVCEHCNKIRHRTETFVVRHENGDEKQVGRQCLAEFLGIDPHRAISYLQSMLRTITELSEEDGYRGGGRGEYYFPLETILAFTQAVIAKDGWLSKSKAEINNGTPTSFTVVDLMHKPYDMTDLQWRAFREEYPVTDEMNAEIVKIREWVRAQSPSNEYMHNIQAIEDCGEANYKLLGYACSMVASYQSAMEKLRLKQNETKLNEWFGAVGDKVQLVVKVMGNMVIEGYYGPTTKFTFLDQDGRRFKWFASREVTSMENGNKYLIKATIKKHDEYQKIKETVLTRVKVVEQINETNH